MASNEARNHHHIPQGYLRGFGFKAKRYWQTNVANTQTQEYFTTNVRNVGAERDFLRINIEGHAPNAIETAMADFEGRAIAAIGRVGETLKFEGDDRITILNLIALLAVRSPGQRENWRQFQAQVMKITADMILSTKERWENTIRRMKADGREVNEEITYEQIKKFHDRGEFDIAVDREWHIGLEFRGFDVVLQTLVDRKWRMFVTDEKKGPFVTSDRPVVLTWTNPSEMPPMLRHSPGHGMSNTELYFPLTHRLAVCGVFDGPEERTEDASSLHVALCNLRMIEHASNQLYTIKKTFPYIGPPRNYYHDSHFMERFAAERARRVATANGDEEQDD